MGHRSKWFVKLPNRKCSVCGKRRQIVGVLGQCYEHQGNPPKPKEQHPNLYDKIANLLMNDLPGTTLAEACDVTKKIKRLIQKEMKK